jgi:hypothetical protein
MTTFNRRGLIGAAAAAAPLAAQAQTPAARAPATPIAERLVARARENALPLVFDGERVSGRGWEMILHESRGCEFVLLGEEHGTREIPWLARQLFLALRPEGFDALGIEISPPGAEDLDRAALAGVAGIKAMIEANPPGPAFYFWETEAELIAAVRAAVPRGREALWGVDYEVTGDRPLIARLQAKAPGSARAALAALDRASQAAWSTWRTSHNPGVLFTFSGDPALVRAVRAAWRERDPEADRILTTLEETLEINRLYGAGQGWASNERRSRLMRRNFVDHLNRAAAHGPRPKALFKMGETHMMRGVSSTGNFDLGTLIHEAAALRGGKAFSLIAGGGKGGRHGVLNPALMTTEAAPADMLAGFMGLGFMLEAFAGPTPLVVDLRPLRALLASETRLKELANPEAARAVFAFDAMLILNGSTPAEMLSRRA